MTHDVHTRPNALEALRLPQRIGLLDGPAPVIAVPSLAQAWGVGELWVKSDGLNTPLYAGNKPRKLEWLLAEARAVGARRLCTFGATGSNHCLATAIHGRAHGFEVEVVVVPQHPSAWAERNFAALQTTGAKIKHVRPREALPLAMVWEGLRAKWKRSERRYVVAPGGSSPLGTLGFVLAAAELAEQVRVGACAEPDVLYVALGSGGTFAGLWLGCALAGLKTEVVGVRVVDWIACNGVMARQLAVRTARVLGKAGVNGGVLGRALLRPMRLVHDQFGEAYGAATEAGQEAGAALGGALEGALEGAGGLKLEPTYTAKTLAAVREDGRRGLLRGRVAMFWNTYNLQSLPSEMV